MPSPIVVQVIVIAITGWFATMFVISKSNLHQNWKRVLMFPSWLPWVTLALGAPIMNGIIPVASALNIGGAMTAGMVVSVIMTRRPRR